MKLKVNNIYGNLRDYLIVNYKETLFQEEENNFFLKENTRDFFLLNNTFSFFKGRQKILYIKLSHIIDGEDADVYEYFNLNYNQTIAIKLRGDLHTQNETLCITYIGEDQQLRICNLSSLFSYSKKNHRRSYDHFYFKFGRINYISIYPFNKKYRWVIYLCLFIALLYYIFAFCGKCM